MPKKKPIYKDYQVTREELDEHYGTGVAIAKAFNVTPESVCRWPNPIPWYRALQYLVALDRGVEPWEIIENNS